MKRARWSSLAIGAAVALGACGNVGAPTVMEPMEVTVGHRMSAPNEVLPTVRFEGMAGGVRVSVARPAFCATLVEAAVDRRASRLTIVTRVSSHPAALCAQTTGAVVDYSGVAQVRSSGAVHVRLYEAIADGAPNLLRAATVRVRPR